MIPKRLLFAFTSLFASALTLHSAETIQGQWQKTVPFHSGVFSVAMGNQISKIPSPTRRPEDSPFLLDCLDKLSPPILRLPGGDNLNHWSWEAGRSLETKGKGGLVMRPDNYLKLIHAAHATGLWGVNTASAPPEDTEVLAKALADREAEARYFELGNELYLPNWTEMTPTAEVYIEKTVPHARLLRKYFPKAKLAVPLASYRQLKAGGARNEADSKKDVPFGWKKPNELDDWMLGLAAQQDFFDAVVLHLYLVPTELGEDGLATHTQDDIRRWAWVRCDAQQVRDLFALVHDVFPEKEIWVTEWCFNSTQYIGGAKSGNKDVRFQVHQSMLAVLYNARFMLNTACDVPYAPIETIWTLSEQPACALLKGDKTGINFELFRLLRWAREGSDGLARLDLSNAPIWKGPAGPAQFDKLQSKAVDVFGFYSGDKLKSVVLLNPTPESVSVEIPRLSEAGIEDTQALCSDEMFPEWGNAANPDAAGWRPPYLYKNAEIKGGLVTVPANSLTVIHCGKKFE